MQKTGKIAFIVFILVIVNFTYSSSFNHDLDLIEKYTDFYEEIKPLHINNKQRFQYYLARAKQCFSNNQINKKETYMLNLELLYKRIENEILALKKEKDETHKLLTRLSQIITANITELKKLNLYDKLTKDYKKSKDDLETLSIYDAKKRIKNSIKTIREALSE